MDVDSNHETAEDKTNTENSLNKTRYSNLHAIFDEESNNIDKVDGNTKSIKNNRTKLQIYQSQCRRMTEHLAVKATIMLLILIDTGIMIASAVNMSLTLDYISLILSIIFLVEVFLRVAGFGPLTFFRNWINSMDFFSVLVNFIVSVVLIVIRDLSHAQNLKFILLLRLLRIPRIILAFVRLYLNKDGLLNSSRYVTSENKRRLRLDGYDLDLCYITDRIIAMSFPSTGITALYRNSMADVAKFLNEHHPHNYRVYNLCEERGYKGTQLNNEVVRMGIKDHNVPRIDEMIELAQNARTWLSANKERVVIMHCRGGKGRTGTMVCVVLLDCCSDHMAGSGDRALSYFGLRRTDLSKGKKFQGVDTPSQGRFVRYFAELVQQRENMQKTEGLLFKKLTMPAPRPLQVCRILVNDVGRLGRGDASDMTVQVMEAIPNAKCGQEREKELLNTVFGGRHQIQQQTPDNVSVTLDLEHDSNTGLQGPLIVDREVKFKFNFLTGLQPPAPRGSIPPRRYDDCAFFFWVHTAFLKAEEGETDNLISIKLDREQLDNPHKRGKLWKKFYGPQFHVEVVFKEI